MVLPTRDCGAKIPKNASRTWEGHRPRSPSLPGFMIRQSLILRAVECRGSTPDQARCRTRRSAVSWPYSGLGVCPAWPVLQRNAGLPKETPGTLTAAGLGHTSQGCLLILESRLHVNTFLDFFLHALQVARCRIWRCLQFLPYAFQAGHGGPQARLRASPAFRLASGLPAGPCALSCPAQ
jgi:hypothetical protein